MNRVGFGVALLVASMVQAAPVDGALSLMRGRTELMVFPVALQTNPRFTSHAGFAVRGAYSLKPNLALTAAGMSFVQAGETDFTRQLLKARVSPMLQEVSLLRSAWLVGLEFAPLHGGYAISERLSGDLALVISAAGGVGSSEVESRQGARVDTGDVLIREVGWGVRLGVGSRVRLRFELRETMYTARVRVDRFGSPSGLTANSQFGFAGAVRTQAVSIQTAYAGIGVLF